MDGPQDAPDQAHIVIRGQPPDTDRLDTVRVNTIQAKRPMDHRQIMDQIPVADHDALGIAGRSGGVLQKRQIIGLQGRPPPVTGAIVRHHVCRLPEDLLKLCRRGRQLQCFERLRRGQCQRGSAIAADCQ